MVTFTTKNILMSDVLYKGHHVESYAQLSSMMSFTHYCKGHSIYAGPERASRNHRIPLKEIF